MDKNDLDKRIAEEERAFGADGISEELAQAIRQDLEVAILERHSPPEKAA